MFPPHLPNGKNAKIEHRKRTQQNKKKDDSNEEQKGNGQENGKKDANKFSFVPHEYNDFTNFYLSQQCIFPATNEGVGATRFMLSAHFHRQKEWHRHPKLRVYQYLNGKGMRFFHSWQDPASQHSMTGYDAQRDITQLWPQWFEGKVTLKADDIGKLEVFDAVMDLYKCDPNFLRWDCAVRRQWFPVDEKKLYNFQAIYKGTLRGYLHEKGTVAPANKGAVWKVVKHTNVTGSKEGPTTEQIVYTLQCGNKYLGIEDKEKGGPVLCMGGKGAMVKPKHSKSSIPLKAYAWTFETFYDEKPKRQIPQTLSIKNAKNERYLIDLVGKEKGRRITHWQMIATAPMK